MTESHDSTTVVKIGGACLSTTADYDALARYLEVLFDDGRQVILVHGGNPQIEALHEDLGVATERRKGLRVTSGESMQLVTMALCGAVNKTLVAALIERNVPALGMSGVDLGILRADFVDRETLGRVGAPPTVDVRRLRRLLRDGLVLVVAPVSLDPEGGLINVNADDAAQAIACALPATTLDFASDVPGIVLADGFARRISSRSVEKLIESAQIRGGMVPKIRAAVEALEAGIGTVRIGTLDSLGGHSATEVVSS